MLPVAAFEEPGACPACRVPLNRLALSVPLPPMLCAHPAQCGALSAVESLESLFKVDTPGFCFSGRKEKPEESLYIST